MTRAPEPCVLCGSRAREIVHHLDIGIVVSCPGCTLVSLVDPDTGLPVTCVYDESYYHRSASGARVGYPDYFGDEYETRSAVAATFAAGLRSAFPRARTTLDVGCGGGYLVGALRATGLDAVGVDTAGYAIRHGVAGARGRLIEGGPSTPDVRARGPFDLVTMMDVIEHLPDPVHAVREAFSLVAPGGALVVLTPRYGGRLSARQGIGYVHFNTDHMYYFNTGTLSRAVEAGARQPVRVLEVMDALTEWGSVPTGEVRAKYTRDRDSIVAVTTRPAS